MRSSFNNTLVVAVLGRLCGADVDNSRMTLIDFWYTAGRLWLVFGRCPTNDH